MRQVLFEGVQNGAGAIFFFALFRLILSILYFIINIRTMGLSGRSFTESLLV